MKVLIVDDEAIVRAMVRDSLNNREYEIYEAESGRRALTLSSEHQFDLIFCDVMMDGMSGFEVLDVLRKNFDPQTEIILMTGNASVDAAVKAVQSGASDYVCKPLAVDRLRALAAAALHRRNSRDLIPVPPAQLSPFTIIGHSPQIIEAVKDATRVAATDLPVVISGPSGSGKELIARLIHKASQRAHRAFLSVNCGALPDALLEAELFGHTRGAFTGAGEARRGLIEEAHEGTLFLDEVTETSAAFQVKLLRFLQEGEVRALGSNARKRVDVRVLSATNRDLRERVETGAFRLDLLYRLQGAEIPLAPLSERVVDIRPLVLAFLGHYHAGSQPLAVTKEAMTALEQYDWPGNVRELQHQMHRLAVLNRGVIGVADLPPEIHLAPGEKPPSAAASAEALPSLEEVEADYLHRVLRAVNGNKSRAAEVMGIDRKTLYRMIERYAKTRDNSQEEPER